MGKDELAIEAEIQAKGLTAPRLTPTLIDATIVAEDFHVFPGTTLTVCALTLRNGFMVTGKSASASPENFNAELGQKIARDNARNKIWALEGYLLRQKLFITKGVFQQQEAAAKAYASAQKADPEDYPPGHPEAYIAPAPVED